MKSWRFRDGRRLAYREAGAGPPLVLLHGWGMSSAVFGGALDWLADRFRVLAPDLPGYGESAAGPKCGFDDLAADLHSWLAGLDVRDATIVGWSMGGQVLLELYPRLSRRIGRLILVSSTPVFAASDDWAHGLSPTRIRVMGRNLKRNPRRTLDDFFALQLAGENITPGRHEELTSFFRREVALPEPKAALEGLEELRIRDQRSTLRSVDCPVLVVHGTGDVIVPPEAGRHLARELPQGELALLAGAGHAPFLTSAEETLELWRAFAR